MVPFHFSRATDDAAAIEAAASGGARFLAGGTTLVDLMREHVEQPAALVDINRLPHRRIDSTPGGLEIGALARMADVAAHPAVASGYPVIAEALLASASPQLRNMASIGGNLLQRTRCTYFRDPGVPCNKKAPGAGCPARDGEHRTHAIFGGSEACVATHASDLAVALIALDAIVHVEGSVGARRFLLAELYRLPGTTPHLEHTLRPDELILRVDVPAAAHAARSHYLKVRDRASYEFALVSAAVALDLDAERGIIRAARIAAGGVGTMPWRLHGVEDALAGRPNVAATWREAAAHATTGAQPLPFNAFKLPLLERAIVRALEHVGGLP
jgi:xanthine dehydrogenase YagS FAD-binding subunit